MDDSLIVTWAETISLCIPALVVSIFGTWASTKNWGFYGINILAFGWMGWVVGNLGVGDTRWMAWIIAVIFVLVLHIGTVVAIQGLRSRR